MSAWNLRRVLIESRVRIVEVYYAEDRKPWTYADASLIDKIRMTRDWMRSPVLRYPEDFTGEPDFLKELERLNKEDWDNWEKL